jgi:nucleotide-binding universal stress UspA family protein
MDKLLVAVDGSKHSAKVVDFAVQIAKSVHASILLVNVPPDMGVPEGYAGYAEEEGVAPGTYYEQVSQGILDQMSDRIARDVDYETEIGVGNPADYILKTAESKKATMIVLGVFGLHNISRIRSLGSVSRRVVENSTLPVVLVP